jgi:hypothetical protein
MKMFFKKFINKIVASRVYRECKIGWDLVQLPNHILKLESRFSVKILKIIGGFCLFLMMSGTANQFHLLIKYYIYIYSFFFILYRLYISMYMIYLYILVVFKGKFIARNSPVNGLNSIFRIITSTLKTSVSVSVGTGISYALCHELDDILVSEGKEPYFVPGMKTLIAKSGMEEQIRNTIHKLGIKDAKPSTITDLLSKMSDEERALYQKETGQSWEKLMETQQNLKDGLKQTEGPKQISEEIKKYIEKEDPFKNK